MLTTFPAIAKLIDLFIKLGELRSKRRKDLFEKVLDPAFDQLLIIHKDYIELFTEALNSLPAYIAGEGWVDKGSNPILQNSATFRSNVEKAKQVITVGREKYETERLKMRSLAKKFFAENLGKEEKRFIWSVLCYFLRPERVGFDNGLIDLQIQIVEKKGGDAVFDTPLSSAATVIAPKDDPNEIRKDLEEAKINQLERWTDVCRLYYELKAEVILRT